MDHSTFHERLGSSPLNRDEKHHAWELYHEQGESVALSYVTSVEAEYETVRRPLKLKDQPLPYGVWGREHIDEASFEQMNGAMRLPISVAGALMPDAHKGYGLPIGGVLATENSVIPYAVGVDIACRMMLTVYPVPPTVLDNPKSSAFKNLRTALEENTIFGAGENGLHDGKIEHPILAERHWQATPLLKGLRKTAIYQIGTSGTGNHFVEWGAVEMTLPDNPLKLQPGHYLALMSHSGSRGVGYKIADYYSKLAMELRPQLHESVKHLAWLTLDSAEGQEYWHAMHLAGDFASANHHVIHARVARAAGLAPIAEVENHHNFAWQETVLVNGQPQEAIVHRKGATPAGQGVLGVIPGTMADQGYIVMGKGEPTALASASHGGGRKMSRNAAKKTITREQHMAYLREHGVTLIGGGLDEAPQAYKAIGDVIGAQTDLVEIVGTFQPRLVRMAADEGPLWKKQRPDKAAPADIVLMEGD